MASEGGGSLVVDVVIWQQMGGSIVRTSIIMYIWSIALIAWFR